VSDIKAIEHLSIEEAELKGHTGLITVSIISDQVSYTTDAAGKPLTGADAVTEIKDLWTFERDLSQADPTWRLVAARSG
jgi:predicted lipid-binding transport protein (Tim44 family)